MTEPSPATAQHEPNVDYSTECTTLANILPLPTDTLLLAYAGLQISGPGVSGCGLVVTPPRDAERFLWLLELTLSQMQFHQRLLEAEMAEWHGLHPETQPVS